MAHQMTCNGVPAWLRGMATLMLLGVAFSAAATSSEEYFREAEAYSKKGDISAAIIQAKNALKEDPKNAKARFLLGEIYLQRGNGAGAEKELDRARRLGMEWRKLIVPLARAYLLQGKAEQLLEEIKADEDFPAPLKAEVLVLRAAGYLGLHKPAEADRLYDQSLVLVADYPAGLLGKARLALRDNNLSEARQWVDRAVTSAPDNAAVWALKGEVARLSGELTAAQSSFRKAVELQPTNLPALLGGATVSIAQGDLSSAEKQIKKVRTLSPKQPVANYLSALIQYQKKDLAGAEQSLLDVLKVKPDYFPALQLKAAIDFAQGNYGHAEQSLFQVISAEPDNIPAAKLLAATKLQLKQMDEAIEILQRLLPAAKDDVQLLAMLGTAYLRNGQLEKGIEYLERAAAADPQAAGIRTQLALGHLASGESVQAIRELETVVDLDLGKEVFQADVLLTMVLLRGKEYDKALAQAQAFAKKLPESPFPDNLMGAAYLGLGKPELGREMFQRAIDKDARFFPAIMNLARLDEGEGKLGAAKKRYLSVLKQQPGHMGALMSLARLAEREGDDAKVLDYLKTAWEANHGALQAGVALLNFYNQKQQPLRAISIARELKSQHPENPLVLRFLGISQAKAEDYHSAKATFEALVKRVPESSQAHYLLGLTQKKLGDVSGARKSFKAALQHSNDYFPAQLALAKLEIEAGRPGLARSIAVTIQQQHPQRAVGYRLLGDILMQQGDYQAAEQSYELGLERTSEAMFAIASYNARKKGKVKQASAPLEQWLKHHPRDVSVKMVLAGAYQENGKLDAAIELYEQVLEVRPKDIVVLNNLAWASHQLGRANALQYAEQAYRLATDNPAVIDTLGWLLVQADKTRRGVDLLRQAVELAPHMSEIRYHLAVGLHRSGKDGEARSELKRALAVSADFAESNKARALLTELER